MKWHHHPFSKILNAIAKEASMLHTKPTSSLLHRIFTPFTDKNPNSPIVIDTLCRPNNQMRIKERRQFKNLKRQN